MREMIALSKRSSPCISSRHSPRRRPASRLQEWQGVAGEGNSQSHRIPCRGAWRSRPTGSPASDRRSRAPAAAGRGTLRDEMESSRTFSREGQVKKCTVHVQYNAVQSSTWLDGGPLLKLDAMILEAHVRRSEHQPNQFAARPQVEVMQLVRGHPRSARSPFCTAPRRLPEATPIRYYSS